MTCAIIHLITLMYKEALWPPKFSEGTIELNQTINIKIEVKKRASILKLRYSMAVDTLNYSQFK